MNSQHCLSYVFQFGYESCALFCILHRSVVLSFVWESRATYLALNRVVPMLNIFAASDSVSRATSASDFLFIGCGEEAGDWRRQ